MTTFTTADTPSAERISAAAPKPEPGEAGDAEHDRAGEAEPVRGHARVEREAAEREQRDRLQRERRERREQHGGEVRRRRQRRRAQPLEHAGLAPHDEDDREPAERRVRGAVAEETGEQHVHGRDAVDLVAVDRAEQCVQEQREDEDEDRRLPASPEDLLLEPELMERASLIRLAVLVRRARGRRPRASAAAPRAARARVPPRAPPPSAR